MPPQLLPPGPDRWSAAALKMVGRVKSAGVEHRLRTADLTSDGVPSRCRRRPTSRAAGATSNPVARFLKIKLAHDPAQCQLVQPMQAAIASRFGALGAQAQ